MSCTDEIARLIPWYAAGTLEDDERTRVEEHLRHCDACRGTLSLAREAVAFGEDHPVESLIEHVHSELLTDFVEHPGKLDREVGEWIAGHLRECEECSEAAAIVREIGADLAAQRSPVVRPPEKADPWSQRIWDFLGSTVLRPAPALGYLVLLLLSFPIYQALVPREAAPRRGSPTGVDAAGSLQITFLHGAARGSAERQRVPLAEGQTMVYLGVEPELPEEVPPDRLYRIAIRSGTRETWSHRMTAAQLRSSLGSDQRAVVLAVPASAVPSGTYTLQVLPDAEPDPILELSFETAR